MKSIRTKYESEFKQIDIEATELAQNFDILVEYKQHRQRKRKRFHEEIAEDEAVFDTRKKFIVESYLVSLDSVINSTSKRFQNFKNVASKFSCSYQKHFNNALDADNINKLKCLADTYSDSINRKTEIMQEFNSLIFKDMFKEIMSSKTNLIFEKLTINNVLKFMHANDMCSIYPKLSTLYHIFLTLRNLAEQSFSRLKVIYLHSTMTGERLSGLALLSIERQFATELHYDKVMDYCAKMKPRRKKLL